MICILFFPYFSISDFFKPLFTQRISSSGGVKTLLCRLVYFAFPFSVAKAALQPPMSVHLSPKPPKIISLYHYLHHYPNHHMQHHTHTIIHTTMHLSDSSIIKFNQASSSIIKCHQVSSSIIKYHQALSSVIKQHQASSSSIKHH